MSTTTSEATLGHSGARAVTRGGRALSLASATFAAAFLAPLFLPAKACTVVYLAFAIPLVIRHGVVVRRDLWRLLSPLFVLFALGLLVDYGSVEWREFAKDLWRLSKPIVLLYVGYIAARTSTRRDAFPQGLMVVGLAYASIYLVRLAFESAARGVMPLDLADTVVFGHFPEAFTVGLCLRYRRIEVRGGALLRNTALGVSLLALGLSGSRTWVLVAGVMILAGGSWLRGRGRLRAVLLVGAMAVGLFLTPLGEAIFKRGFDVALSEISPARYTELGDIATHWRGFEAWQGLRAYLDGSALQHAIGQGFGATAGLGFYIEHDGDHYNRVSQFHNGFIWPLLKTGFVGAAVFVVWFGRLIGMSRALGRASASPENRAAADLCLGVVLSLVLTTLVVSGIFNNVSNDPMVLVIGGFLALTHRRG